MIKKIVLSAFRGIENREFLFGNKTHIVGKNGSGKTHILDALHLLTGAKNIYGNTSLEVNDRIEVFFGEEFQEKSYILSSQSGKENFFIQNKKYTKPKYLETLPFRTVYVSPFDMNLLYFSPSMRRDYIDDILARAYWQFSKIKREYEQIMRQRNALLKKIREKEADISWLDFWDKKFAEIATTYGLYRKKYIAYISEKIPDFPEFFGGYHIEILYETNWAYEDNTENFIISYLQKNRERDIFSGHTHIGPHRDDFSLQMTDMRGARHSVQFFLSRGETKMLLLGLKIIECDFLEKHTQKTVVLLVDDIFAELDEENAILFLNIIIQHQIILTSQKSLPNAINSQKFTCINLMNE